MNLIPGKLDAANRIPELDPSMPVISIPPPLTGNKFAQAAVAATKVKEPELPITVLK